MKRSGKFLSEQIDSFGVPLEEMARVWPEDSGLPVTVIILVGEGLPHGPRIKISTFAGGKVREDSLVQVTIEDEPQFIGKLADTISSKLKKRVSAFIQKNKQVLTDHYCGRISDKQALNQLKAV